MHRRIGLVTVAVALALSSDGVRADLDVPLAAGADVDVRHPDHAGADAHRPAGDHAAHEHEHVPAAPDEPPETSVPPETQTVRARRR